MLSDLVKIICWEFEKIVGYNVSSFTSNAMFSTVEITGDFNLSKLLFI